METLDAVMYSESRCGALEFNADDPNGGSRGLLQINGSWWRYLIDGGIIERLDDLYDPEVNLRAGLAIWQYGIDKHGYGWHPWKASM